jgi:BRCA1-associated protein
MGATTQRDDGLGPTQADALSAEKIEAIGIEYSYLLTSQLDSQRAFYESQTNELKQQLSDLKSLVGRLTLDFEEERQRAKEAEAKRRAQEEDSSNQVAKEKAKAEERAEKAVKLAKRLGEELQVEKAMSESLMKNLVVMREREENFTKDKEAYAKKVSELEDQVRDVMFFLEAKTKIENGEGVEAEAAGGSLEISMPPPPPPESSSARTNANGKKKARRKGG